MTAPETPTPPTLLLSQRDAYQRACEATVLAVDPASREVALDQSVFYPGGGGQPCDTGTLRSADGAAWPVTAVRKAGPTAWHALGGDGPLPEVGQAVTGEIDWERRHRLMRTHTALHVLCGVVFRDYGSLVTGGNMGVDGARMDFEMDSADFTPARVAEIAAGHPTRVRFLPREEAFQIPDLIRTKTNLLPEGIAEVRIVEIVGLDLQADGGTHVADTREVGGLRVVGTRSKGKANKRLEIVLVDDAVAGDAAS